MYLCAAQNLAHALHYRKLDINLWRACGENFEGLIESGLLHPNECTQLLIVETGRCECEKMRIPFASDAAARRKC